MDKTSNYNHKHKTEIKQIVFDLDKTYPGQRTRRMLDEWVNLLVNFPIRNVKAIIKRLIHTQNPSYYPTIDKMLEAADKVAEEIKLQDRAKYSSSDGDIFNLNRLAEKNKSSGESAKLYRKLWKKHGSDFYSMAKEMIELEKQYPNCGLAECGKKHLRYLEESEKKVAERKAIKQAKLIAKHKKELVG